MTRGCLQLHASDAAATHVHGGAGADVLASFLTFRSDVLSGQKVNISLSAREKFEIIVQRATVIEVGMLQQKHFFTCYGIQTSTYCAMAYTQLHITFLFQADIVAKLTLKQPDATTGGQQGVGREVLRATAGETRPR